MISTTIFLLKRLVRLLHPNKFHICISLIFGIISSCLEGISFGLLIPLLDGLIKGGNFGSTYNVPFFGNLILLLSLKRNMHIFSFLLFLVMFIVCANHIIQFFSEITVTNICERAGHAMRSKIFDRYMGFTKTFFDKNKIGYLHNILLSQTDRTVEFLHVIFTILLHFMIGVAYFAVMLFISWKLTFITLVFLPAIYILINNVTNRIKMTSSSRLQIEQDMASSIFDILSAMPLIKSYVTEERESRKFEILSDSLRKEKYSLHKKLSSIPHIQEIAIAVSVAMLIGIATYLFKKGDRGMLAAFLVYFVILRRLVGEFKVITYARGEIASRIPSIEKTLWVFQDKDKSFIRNGKIEFKNLTNRISFENLSFSYDNDREILQDISLTIHKGTMVAIVGPTGAGKTTLISLIPRFYDFNQGSLKIDGIDVREYELKSLRRRIGIVSQDIFIFNDTIRNNIIYGLGRKIEEEEIDRAAKLANIFDLIVSLPQQYETFVGDRGIKLSGGERQRVAMARTILRNPDILILDEATSSLDTDTERLIQSAIENLVKNRTTIVIAHRLSTIENADWVIVLENGKITEEGRHNELLNKRGRFYYYWQLQKFH